jgi:hypothetical protein
MNAHALHKMRARIAHDMMSLEQWETLYVYYIRSFPTQGCRNYIYKCSYVSCLARKSIKYSATVYKLVSR